MVVAGAYQRPLGRQLLHFFPTILVATGAATTVVYLGLAAYGLSDSLSRPPVPYANPALAWTIFYPFALWVGVRMTFVPAAAVMAILFLIRTRSLVAFLLGGMAAALLWMALPLPASASWASVDLPSFVSIGALTSRLLIIVPGAIGGLCAWYYLGRVRA